MDVDSDEKVSVRITVMAEVPLFLLPTMMEKARDMTPFDGFLKITVGQH